jgi:heptosyltransferase-2
MKILVVKISAIGDVIMATTMLEAIQNKYGDSDITWICGKNVFPILSKYSIQHLIPINETKVLMGSTVEKIFGVLSLWKQIAGKSYDLLIIAHSDYRYSLLTLPVIAKKRVCFNEVDGRKIPIPGRYHGNEYARLITNDENASMKQWYPLEIPNLNKSIIKNFIGKSRPIIVLAPGGAKNVMRDDILRRWPIEYYVKLAGKLIQTGYTVAITGAFSDKWIEPYFAKLDIISFVGKTNLMETLNIFEQVNMVITHDSGPLHLAILVHANVIGIFGPTMPSEKVPVADNIHVLWNTYQLACCPCYDAKKYADCTDNQCLKKITVEDVLRETEKWMHRLNVK